MASSLHWKVAPLRFELKRKVAERLAINPEGPEVIDVLRAAAAAGSADSVSAARAMRAAADRHRVINEVSFVLTARGIVLLEGIRLRGPS